MSKIKSVLKQISSILSEECLLLKMALFGVDVLNSKKNSRVYTNQKKTPELHASEKPNQAEFETLAEKLANTPCSPPRPGARITFGGWRPPKNSSPKPKPEENELLKYVREIGLDPIQPVPHAYQWLANCPSYAQHRIMISTQSNTWGCSYCRKKGDVDALKEWMKILKK